MFVKHLLWVLFLPASRRYTEEELKSVKVFHRTPENAGDKIALALVKLARYDFSFNFLVLKFTEFSRLDGASTLSLDTSTSPFHLTPICR